VAKRTEELRDAMEQLQQAHGTLNKSFLNTVRVLSGLIEMREGRLGGHSRRVADAAHSLARELGMDEGAAQDVMLAGLLHDLGKIGLPDDILRKPELELSDPERAIMRKHPVTAELALMAVESLHEAARIIRHHHERYDGQGYPDGIKGDAIPLGARILALVNDFDSLQTGEHFPRKLSRAEARQYLRDGSGTRYDPRVVNAFIRQWKAEDAQADGDAGDRAGGVARVPRVRGARGARGAAAVEMEQAETEVQSLRPKSLKPGMVLVDDAMHPDGYLLLSRGFVFDDRVITRLTRLEGSLGVPMWLAVSSGDQEAG
jgi:HD-GYP domain-containing protein (c-di-GMP phosphodiesterase class II)